MICPLDVRRASLQPHDVRVVGQQLGGVLDDDEPLAGVAQAQQRAEPGRLAGARAARDQHGEPRVHHGAHPRRHLRGQRPGVDEVVEAESASTRHAQRQAGAGHGDRGEHRVDPRAVGQSRIHVGRGVVEASSAGGGEPLGEPAHGVVVGEPHVDRVDAVAAIDPHLVRTGDQDVGDERVAQQPAQRTRPGHLPVQPLGLGEQDVRSEQHAVVAQRPRDVRRGRRTSVGDEPLPHPVEHGRRQAHRATSWARRSAQVRPSRERVASPGGSPRSRAVARRGS